MFKKLLVVFLFTILLVKPESAYSHEDVFDEDDGIHIKIVRTCFPEYILEETPAEEYNRKSKIFLALGTTTVLLSHSLLSYYSLEADILGDILGISLLCIAGMYAREGMILSCKSSIDSTPH